MVVRRAIGLDVIVGLGEDYAIDQNSGDLDFARIERVCSGDPLDLRDDETTRVFGGHGRSEIVEGKRLPLHR